MLRSHVRGVVEAGLVDVRKELIASTSRILQFESVSGSTDPEERARHEAEMKACAAFVSGLAKKMGFRWLEKPGRWYCIEWPGEAAASGSSTPPVILVATHIDVVPASGVWAIPPFSGKIADDAVWGRGAVDMKGPLMSCLYGLYALKRGGFIPPATYRILIGTQEEINEWSDIEDYLAQEGVPDYGFTPDACFPVVIGEKGTLLYSVESKWSVDPSPASGIEPVGLRGGTRPNVVPDHCEVFLRFPGVELFNARAKIYAAIGQFETDDCLGSIEYSPEDTEEAEDGRLELRVVFRGMSAHGSTPGKGHSAVLDALRFLQILDQPPGPFCDFTRFLLEAGSDPFGGPLDIESTHPFLGPTTVNLGMVEIERPGGKAIFNVRPTLGLSIAEAERRIERAARAYSPLWLKAWRFQRVRTAFEPLYLDPETVMPFLRGLLEGVSSVTGETVGFCAIPYTTYAKAMPNCCAFGPILHSAGEVEMAHEPDERVTIEALTRNMKIFALALAYAGMNLAAES